LVALVRTVDTVQRLATREFSPYGITPQQYNVLRILRGAGEDGLPTLTVGERMMDRTPGVTRLIDRIEARGWVERRRCEVDRRRVYCVITPAGLELLEKMDPLADEMDALSMSEVSDQELDVLIEALSAIRSACEDDEAV
jgi:DNA-binding MarR family transcriptional regulator